MVWFVVEVLDQSPGWVRRVVEAYVKTRDEAEVLISMFRDGFICRDYIPGDVIQCYRPGLPSRRRVITVRRVPILEDLIIAKKEGVIT